MRKLILSLAVSLDGYIEGPNGEYDWCFMDQDYGMAEFMNRVDAVFVGRKTYEMSLGLEADASGMPAPEEYVFSTTLDTVTSGKVLVKVNIESEVEKIKNKAGKDIWLFGGAHLTSSLMNLKLVDEIHVAIHPILLGGGKPLFRDLAARTQLKLIDSKTYSTGLVALIFAVSKEE